MKAFFSPIRILRFGLFALVFSRGFLYVSFSTPFRSLFWNESLFSPVVNSILGMSWKAYADTSDPWIGVLENIIGLLLMASAFCFLTIKNETQKVQVYAITFAGVVTLVHLALKYIGHNHELPMIPEYMLQALAPWLFLSFLPYFPKGPEAEWGTPPAEVHFWTRFAISMCFIGHGLYAFGIPYQPASFVRMLTTVTFIEYDTSSMIVRVIGAVDIVLGVTVFIRPFSRFSLKRMAVWGFITASARVLAFVIVPGKLDNIHPWLFETTVRLIHGAMPLFLLLLIKQQVLNDENYFSLNPRSWIKRWQSVPVSCVIVLLILAEISTTHSFTSQPDLELAEKLEQKRSPSTQDASETVVPQDVQLKDFQLSTAGYYYSDRIFQNDIAPTRLRLETNPAPTSLPRLNAFLANKAEIVKSLKTHIVKQFNEARTSHTLSDEEILRFTEKIVFLHDGDRILYGRIYAPWAASSILYVEIRDSGHVETISQPRDIIHPPKKTSGVSPDQQGSLALPLKPEEALVETNHEVR